MSSLASICFNFWPFFVPMLNKNIFLPYSLKRPDKALKLKSIWNTFYWSSLHWCILVFLSCLFIHWSIFPPYHSRALPPWYCFLLHDSCSKTAKQLTFFISVKWYENNKFLKENAPMDTTIGNQCCLRVIF